MVEPPDAAPPRRQAFSLMGNSVIERQPPGLQRLEDHEHGHELAHAGRRHQVIGILLVEDLAGARIHEDRKWSLALELRRLGGLLRRPSAAEAGKRQRCHEASPRATSPIDPTCVHPSRMSKNYRLDPPKSNKNGTTYPAQLDQFVAFARGRASA